MKRTQSILIGASVALTLLSLPGIARAGAKRCRSSPGTWNAPKGAAVVIRTPGVVSAIFDVAGLNYTHVMLSAGPKTMFHASRPDPKRNSDWDVVFNRPFHTDAKVLASGNQDSTLSKGTPGVSRLNMGATYASMYGSCSHASLGSCGNGPVNAGKYITGTDTDVIADYLLDLPTEPVWESFAAYAGQNPATRTRGVDRVRLPQPASNIGVIPASMELSLMTPYSFYQFKNLGTAHLGTVPPDGLACSTFLAWAAHRALGATVSPAVFPFNTVTAALDEAHDAAKSTCEDQVANGDWLLQAGASIGSVCEKAGDQIANCFVRTDPLCRDYGDEYKSLWKWSGGLTATVIAPDHLIQPTAPSPWRTCIAFNGLCNPAHMQKSLQWSSEGDVFGCWETDEHWPN